MRVANKGGRLVIVADDGVIDVERASGGRFPSDPQTAYERWGELLDWARAAAPAADGPYDEADLEAPVPRPRQIFAVGLNYVDHAKESRLDLPTVPMVFTKFQSSITGPTGTIPRTGETVDWEVELVVVIGAQAEHVSEDEAWDHVAGLTIGQDISDRDVQQAGSTPQFSLGKSFPRFAPIGPVVVTPDEFEDPDDLELRCDVGDETMQHARTTDLVFPIPKLIAYLSSIVTLFPGDLIFTGTPSGVGLGRTPTRYLQLGEVVTTSITGIGTMRHTVVESD